MTSDPVPPVQREGPVGIFDSGVGGLTVLKEIQTLLPGENLVYFADTAHCPYGPQPLPVIRGYAEEASRSLINQGAKVIVVACNTASSAALKQLRATFDPFPFVGLVPAVKPAALATRTGKVGVIATQATAHAELFAELVDQYSDAVKVITKPCPGLVELVEKGQVDTPAVVELLHRYLDPLLEAGIDELVLGCTHYPFLRPTIERIVGPAVAVIDSGEAIARRVKWVLETENLLSPRTEGGEVTYITTGDRDAFARTLENLRLAGCDLGSRVVQC